MEEISFIDKPWGYERWLEVNENYVVKELFMKAGHSCSLQYHEKKHETFVVVSGLLKMTFGPSQSELKDIVLKPGAFWVLPPGVIHRCEGIENSLYIECSTNHLDDVIRLEDKYGRV
jgi:mannose-6-phosphate isomerase